MCVVSVTENYEPHTTNITISMTWNFYARYGIVHLHNALPSSECAVPSVLHFIRYFQSIIS